MTWCCLLQPTFSRLNIHLDTRTSNALMRQEAGVALRLLYTIKQALSQLNVDLQVSWPPYLSR